MDRNVVHAVHRGAIDGSTDREAVDHGASLLPPEHPAEIAALYAHHLRHPVVVDPTSPDLVEKIALFCDGLPPTNPS